MPQPHRLLGPVLALSLAVSAGCKVAAPTTTTGKTPHASPAPDATPSASGTARPTASPLTTLSTPGPAHTYFGRVLGTDGKGAPGVNITAYLISQDGATLVTDNGSGLVTDNGSGIIANHGGGLVTDNGSGVIANNGGGYRLLAANPVVTDANGEFSLSIPENQGFNVEADKGTELKALHPNVTSKDSGIQLQLAPPGEIDGKVAFPEDPKVKDFTGVQVFIPGSSYFATADAGGNFKLTGVPVGSFPLFATRRGLGGGHLDTVEVKSSQTTDVGTLNLKLIPLAIQSVDPPAGTVGTVVTLEGGSFGADQGLPCQVRLNGRTLDNAKVVDNGTITFTVPDGYDSGPLVVDVDGHVSAEVQFNVISKFSVSAPRSVALGRTATLIVNATNAAKKAIDKPPVKWAVTVNPDVASVDASGVVTPLKAGQVTVTATIGTMVATIPLTVAATEGQAGLGGRVEPLLHGLRDVAFDPDGHTAYLASAGNILKYDLTANTATLLAGGSSGGGSSSVDGVGSAARFIEILSMVVDPAGGVDVVESDRVRQVKPDGTVVTLAGQAVDAIVNGTIEDKPGPADKALFVANTAIARGKAGSLRILDNASLFELANDTVTMPLEFFPASGWSNLTLTQGALCVDDNDVTWTVDGNAPMNLAPYGGSAQPINFTPGTGDVADWIGLVRDGSGAFYATGDNYLFRIDPVGQCVTLAGNATGTAKDGDAATAGFSGAGKLAFGPGHVLYLAEPAGLRTVTFNDDGSLKAVTTVVQPADSLKTYSGVVPKK